MTPSPEAPYQVKGEIFGYPSFEKVILSPIETVTSQEVREFVARHLSWVNELEGRSPPEKIFYFPQANRFSHLDLVSRLCGFGIYHPTTGDYQEKTLQWGNKAREGLLNHYHTQIEFGGAGIKSIRILPKEDVPITLFGTKSSYQESDFEHLIKINRGLHAFLALNAEGQKIVLEMADGSHPEEIPLVILKSITSRWIEKKLRVGDILLIRKGVEEGNYRVRKPQLLEKIVAPTLVVVEGPQPSLSAHLQALETSKPALR